MSLGTFVNRQFLAFAWPTVTSTPRKHHNHKIPGEMDGCMKNCAETRSPTKDTCATRKLTNRCCVHVCANSALDVSGFLSPLSVETDITYTRRINTANSCICHHVKDSLLIVYMALASFAMFTPSAKMVQVSVVLVSSVTHMRVHADGMRHCTNFSIRTFQPWRSQGTKVKCFPKMLYGASRVALRVKVSQKQVHEPSRPYIF